VQCDCLGVGFEVFICGKALVQLGSIFVKNFDVGQWLPFDLAGLLSGWLAGLHLDVFRFDQVFYEPLGLGGLLVCVQACGEGFSGFLADQVGQVRLDYFTVNPKGPHDEP
jgi:hypothetical protein